MAEDAQAAFALAHHEARYAHRESVVFRHKRAGWTCERYGRGALKAAMLAVGTQGHFFVVSGKRWVARVGWREAIIRLRNTKHMDHADA